MEIGSIYEVDPDRIEELKQTPLSPLSLKEVEKYGRKNNVYTASGREAVGLALKSLADTCPELPKRCLLPAYMCDSVFFPFTHNGWEIIFYHIGRNLQADREELCRLTEQIRPGLLFIHAYYGVDTWKPMRFLLKQWRARGIRIMEDVTQSYYLREAGQEADYIVGSLRKWYPAPDGGFLSSDLPLLEKGLIRSGDYTERRLELLTEKWRYLQKGGVDGNRKERYLRKNRETEEWLDRHSGINTISNISAKILMAEDEALCRSRRNANYRYLAETLKDRKCCSPALAQRAEAPLYFPVYAAQRESLQDYLREHDIYAPVLWPAGRENREILTKEERYIYEHLLALPLDQRYGETAMRRIVQVLRQYEDRPEE